MPYKNIEKRKKYLQEYFLNNKERKKEYLKGYYLNNKERRKLYLLNNKDKKKKNNEKYRKNNKENVKKTNRLYRLKYKEKLNEISKLYRLNNRSLVNAYAAKRRASKLKATPRFANLNKIKEIYKNCPKGYHVDHIVPLQGENVCGLHVEWNLQYLTPSANISKSNKLII
jgi:hypothetical protein